MKEKLQKRIDELLKAKEQFLANVHACEGAIGELRRIIGELDEEEKTDK